MPRKRVPTKSGLSPEQLRPQASPVDTFTNPRGSKALRGLAQGLAEIEPSLARFAQTTIEQEAKESQQEGAARAQELIDQQLSYKEAVDQGLIRRDQNPWFRLGLKRQFAMNAANDYAATVAGEAAALIEGGETNPEAFEAMEAELRRKWVRENIGPPQRDRQFDAFFADAVNNKVAGIARGFAQQAGTEAVRQAITETREMVFGVFDSNYTGENADALVAQVEEIADSVVDEMGLSARKINETVVDGLIEFAVAERDYSVLDLLDKIQLGTGPLGQTSYAIRQREVAEEEIRRGLDQDRARERRRRQEMADQLWIDLAEEIEEKGLSEVPLRERLLTISQMDPRAVNPLDVEQQVYNASNATSRADPERLRWLRAQALARQENFDVKGLTTQYLNGQLTPHEYTETLPYARQAAQLGGTENNPLEDDMFTDDMSFLRAVARGGGMTAQDLMESRLVEVNLDDAQQAAYDRTAAYVASEEYAEATPWERRQERERIIEGVRQDFFPLTALEQEQRRVAGPLDWNNEEILDRGEAQELVDIVRGTRREMSNALYRHLRRYGVNASLDSEESVRELAEIARGQGMLHGIIEPPQETAQTPSEGQETPEEGATPPTVSNLKQDASEAAQRVVQALEEFASLAGLETELEWVTSPFLRDTDTEGDEDGEESVEPVMDEGIAAEARRLVETLPEDQRRKALEANDFTKEEIDQILSGIEE